MKAHNLVNADELYFVIGQDENATETQPGLMSAADKVKLNGIADGAEVNVQSDWNVTNTASDAYIKNKPTALPANGGNADTVNNHTVETNVPAGAVFTDTVYTHPTYTAKTNGLYKITVDNTGHVSGTNSVSKADITALGIPAQDTTYGGAGTSLGLVKSGGDVTISNGVITVNDDSHNHTISNIDNLQATLNNKVDKVEGSRLITASEASKLESLVIGESGQIEISGKVNADNVEGLTEKLNTKVDKVAGKGLSTNDYTTEEKEKLAGLNSANYVAKSGDTMTGKLTAPQIETGAADTNYFQSRKFRGEGDASTYYHAIDFGYANHDQVDFYEYGGLWNFYKNTSSTKGGTLCGKISINGWEGSAKLTGTPTAPTAANGTNNTQIATTAFVQTATNSKVDKVTGKDLSSNDYTTEEKEKLAGIETGANKTIIDSALSSTSTNPVQNKIINTKFDSIQANINSKVDSVDGKGLSTNDLTDTLKSNYDAAYTHSNQAHAPSNAEKNVIVGIQKNGTDLTVNSSARKVNITVPTKISELTNDSNFATTTALDSKVDKVTGKGLSTNDYTTAEKDKLASIENGANKTVVDTELSSTSTNPLQNKAIYTKFTSIQSNIDNKVPSSRSINGKALTSDITLSASDVGALPNTTVIPSIDGLATETYVNNKVAGIVDSAPATLDTLNELAAALGDDPNFATTVATQIGNKVDKVDGKGLSTNDYTTAEKNKLSGIAEKAEVNQNAFSNIVVGSTTVAADSKTDTLTLVAGNNVTLTPDATNDKITIASKDTVYTHPSYTARTGVPTANQTPAFGGTFNVSQPVSDATGHITAINSRTITIPKTEATTSKAGLMSASDKSKLDGLQADTYLNKTGDTMTGALCFTQGVGFGTDTPANTIANPVEGQIYFQIISE